MVGDPASRSLLPQTSQSQNMSFMTSNPTPREPLQRNYVFVDEHNRHKRLKVMRACEGCRRRKIKCDAATTNTWPCAACTRLKLTCVPPTVSYEKDSNTTPGIHTFELQRASTYPNVSLGPVLDFQRHPILQQQLYGTVASPLSVSAHAPFAEVHGYPQPVFVEPASTQDVMNYASLTSTSLGSHELNVSSLYQAPRSAVQPAVNGKSDFPSWQSDSGVSSIVDALGELKIDHLAQAPFITERNLAETPAVAEVEIKLPESTSSDNRVRIPPEMMPSEQEALQYIDFYFNHTHPFVPVLSRQAFLHQWQNDRDNISPLLMEAIFACATGVMSSSGLMEAQPGGNKWLALATKHEDNFRDVPRVSTLQAMIIILKARETSPRRGYFYRSWMSLVNLVAMAKDLGLHLHHETHQAGNSCRLNSFECLSRTRIWQVLYVLEVMVGGPQGRSDFGISNEMLDFNVPQPLHGIDEDEYKVWRQMTFLTQIISTVRRTVRVYHENKAEPFPWAMLPEYKALDEVYAQWSSGLPRDINITIPQDGSAPWVPSPFVGHLHCYYYLSIIMHHRPQIHFLTEPADAPTLKHHMLVCQDAAKRLCRIQESMLRSHGIPGMLAMLRGMNFTIYCILTCNMIHLAAITNPDEDLNIDARDYFVRHMRLLEECAPSWSLLEMRDQINALREAFSKDTSKPFELNDNFPYASSPARSMTTPPVEPAYPPSGSNHEVPLEPSGQVPYNMMQPITPPISATNDDSKADSPLDHSLAMIPGHTHAQAPAVSSAQTVQGQWNPIRLFDQWNVAFGPPSQNSPSQPAQPISTIIQSAAFDIRSPSDISQAPYTPQSPYSPHSPTQMQLATTTVAPRSYPPAYVSPSMWQDVVASTFGEGVKRRWDYSGQQDLGPMAKRHR